MERNDSCDVSRLNRKRKLEVSFPMDELNQDLLERVLSWLPTSSLYRVGSVCKRWKSVTNSASFRLACSEVPRRDPWFVMVDPHHKQPTIFDSAERCWRKLDRLSYLQQHGSSNDSVPVAASGSLVCFRDASNTFAVCNPVTGLYHKLPLVYPSTQDHPLQAVAMSTSSNNSYKLVLVCGELPRLSYIVYESNLNRWGDEVMLKGENDHYTEESNSIDEGENVVYFLSKAGDVVVTNMEKSPSKQYSSVMTHENGEVVYFLNSSGAIIACNLTRKLFTKYPRLLPIDLEYSIDVVKCRGELLVVVLSELFESASVRVWKFEENIRSWQQVAAMPPAMAQEYYRKRVDVNCVGADNRIFICLSSTDTKFYSYVACDLLTDEWTDLPNAFANGEAVEFMSAFTVEPRIEVSV